MSVKRGELIVGHIPQELSKRLVFSVVEVRGAIDHSSTCILSMDRRVTGETFRDSNGFGVSYRDDYDSTTRPRAERCSNPFPRFSVYAEFNKRRLRLVAALE